MFYCNCGDVAKESAIVKRGEKHVCGYFMFNSQLYCALAAKKELKTEIYFVNCVLYSQLYCATGADCGAKESRMYLVNFMFYCDTESEMATIKQF